MQFVARIERTLDIMIETDDVIATSDYAVVVETLRTRYDIVTGP